MPPYTNSVSSSSSTYSDVLEAKVWVGATAMDTLFTNNLPPKVDFTLGTTAVIDNRQKYIQSRNGNFSQRRSSLLSNHFQRLNPIRRSLSVFENRVRKTTKPPLSSQQQQRQDNTVNTGPKGCGALQVYINDDPCLNSTSMSRFHRSLETHSAPVSPIDKVPRQSSFSHILKKTFDMKSIFNIIRKDNTEREQEALAIWQQTFEESLLTNSSSTVPTAIYDADRCAKYAKFIVMELLSTEETYVSDLFIIKTKFMDPLVKMSQQPRSIINGRDIRTIFAFVPQLLLLSATLAKNLRSALQNAVGIPDMDNSYDWVGRVFYDLESSFDIYLFYAMNFEKSRKCLNKIGCDALCHQLIQNSPVRKRDTKRLELSDFMITPIQRITRYCLLLKDLRKHSSKSELIDRSVKLFTSLALAMNDNVE